MTGSQIRQEYLNFFKTPPRNHAEIPASRLVPENDPTTLFTSSGMQQLVPYLKGEPHSMGNRLVDAQPSFRAEDIDEIGDNRHTTFFEMLGNWSLGDYFKADQLRWVYQFMTQVVGLDSNKLHITIFAGNSTIAKDEEAVAIWQEILQADGIDPQTHIHPYASNWWSRAGAADNMPVGEIGGPDSEIFYDFGEEHQFHQRSPWADQPCHPNCDCGRFLEIGNSVFMQYIKTESGFTPLPKQNVDFGGGLERITAASQDQPDVFLTDLFLPIINQIEQSTHQPYQHFSKEMRVIADHLRAATFLIAEGITPSNKMQGYFLRRLLRRSLVKLQSLKPDINLSQDQTLPSIAKTVVALFADSYLTSASVSDITGIICEEQNRFGKTLAKGLKIIQSTDSCNINGKFTFDLYQSYGFPLEITEELVKEQGITVDRQVFREEFKKHQDISRAGSQGLFKGGLADHSDTIVKYHTTTHLLQAALRQVLGDHVQQMGSNITAERLRFDFKHTEKLTPEQLAQVGSIINQQIQANLPVHKQVMPKDQALQSGAIAFFRNKYPDTVTVYTIGANPESKWISKELCGGPHVSSTGDIGPVTINKEEAVGAGIRRIYITLKQP